MSVTSFIPQLWSAKLKTQLRNKLVSEKFVNHDYVGTVIGFGSVKINTLSPITVKDYDGNAIEYDDLNTTEETLLIDRKKTFGFKVDDLDYVQTANGGALMNSAVEDGAYSIADARDKANFKTLVDGAGVEIGTAGAPNNVTTAAEAKALLLKLRAAADKAKVPQEGRVVAVGPDFYNLLLNDPYITLAKATTDGVVLEAYLGRLFGLDLYNTNNLPKDESGNDYVVLSHPKFMVEASQIEKIEALRDINAFKDIVRGLDVSGAKVIRPEGVIKAVVKY